MSKYLIDTNILIRAFEADINSYADKCISLLLQKGNRLYVAPQVIIEFWCVTTRPCDVNGLGWDVDKTANSIKGIVSRFLLAEDNMTVFNRWLELVSRYEIKGKRTHDARLVAVMLENGIENLLTFNTDDFAVFEEIKAINPSDVVTENNQIS